MDKETKKRKISSKKVIISKMLIKLIIVLTLLVTYIFFIYDYTTSYCEKTTIQNQLKKVIINGGDLDAVKDAYNDRYLKPIFLSFRLSPRSVIKDYYKEDVPLSVILSNLRTRFYLEKEQRRYSYKTQVIKDSILVDADSLYFSLLNKIIDEYNKKNPFDKLEPNQRDFFINLQQKLDTGYVKVSGDISKIVDEMDDRNQLVTKYLNDSKKSLRISWIALIVTFILSSYQIYQNWKSSKNNNKRFDEIEKMINKKE